MAMYVVRPRMRLKAPGRATVTPGGESRRLLVQTASPWEGDDWKLPVARGSGKEERVTQSAGRRLPKLIEGWAKVSRLEEDDELEGRDRLHTERGTRLFSVRKALPHQDGSLTERARTSHTEAQRSKPILVKRGGSGRARIHSSSSTLRPWTPDVAVNAVSTRKPLTEPSAVELAGPADEHRGAGAKPPVSKAMRTNEGEEDTEQRAYRRERRGSYNQPSRRERIVPTGPHLRWAGSSTMGAVQVGFKITDEERLEILRLSEDVGNFVSVTDDKASSGRFEVDAEGWGTSAEELQVHEVTDIQGKTSMESKEMEMGANKIDGQGEGKEEQLNESERSSQQGQDTSHVHFVSFSIPQNDAQADHEDQGRNKPTRIYATVARKDPPLHSQGEKLQLTPRLLSETSFGSFASKHKLTISDMKELSREQDLSKRCSSPKGAWRTMGSKQERPFDMRFIAENVFHAPIKLGAGPISSLHISSFIRPQHGESDEVKLSSQDEETSAKTLKEVQHVERV
uniref:Uncharacterized protein n=1 Tax=Hanusia phi TaxID=3032 RepID=A0A7S0F5F7_9CRYP